MFTFSRGYAERQKIMAVLVEGQFMEVFLTPQNLGGGGCIPLDVAVVSLTLLVTGVLIGSRFNHLYYTLTPPPRDTYNNSINHDLNWLASSSLLLHARSVMLAAPTRVDLHHDRNARQGQHFAWRGHITL